MKLPQDKRWEEDGIFDEISAERERQDVMWGDQWRPGVTDPFQKINIMTEELLESYLRLVRIMNDKGGAEEDSEFRKELIQLVAVGTAMLESIS